MRPALAKHPKADDTIFITKNNKRVRLYSKSQNEYYLVVCVKNGRQEFCKKEQFKNPELLPF